MRAFSNPPFLPLRPLPSQVDHWIFDLDNTLYPASSNLFHQIDTRMGEFVAKFLNVDMAEARRIQKQYYRDYGATLRGLMRHHGLDPEAYLTYVHDIDHSPIQPDPRLAQALRQLDGQKIVFTNGSRDHALRVLDRLGITDVFDHIHDIADSDYIPKPHRTPYDKLVNDNAIDPGRAVIFEDIARNLEIPHALGMGTVLVQDREFHPDDGTGLPGQGDEPHVDLVTQDLPALLETLSEGTSSP